MRFLVIALMLLLSILGSPAHAQPDRLTTEVALQTGIGYSYATWDEQVERWSYLPEGYLNLASTVAYTNEANNQVLLEPRFGLHVDALQFDSEYGDYQDHYVITSLRAGFLLLAGDEVLRVGFGPEARRPIHVRSRLRSRAIDGRTWIRAPDPDVFDQWGIYWIYHFGVYAGNYLFFIELTKGNDANVPPASFLAENPIEYLNLHVGLHFPLEF